MTSPRSKTKEARRRLQMQQRIVPGVTKGLPDPIDPINAAAIGFGVGFLCCALWVALLVHLWS